MGELDRRERRLRKRVEAIRRKVMTPEMEEQVALESLREHAGIDPDILGEVADLTALGLANSWWRDSCVEDWHAAGRLSDDDMLRVNSYTTQRIRQRLRGWLRETHLDPLESVEILNDLDPGDFAPLLERLYQWCAAPGRHLPTGQTLAELAGVDLPAYTDHVDRAVGSFSDMIDERGGCFAFLRAAAHGALACPHWWGHPKWPALVAEFTAALDDPAHAYWGTGPVRHAALPPEPAGIADREHLRAVLLQHPWELDTDSAQWLTTAGLRHQPARSNAVVQAPGEASSGQAAWGRPGEEFGDHGV
jgi:hypothetical protein